jgi:hypothetical protein
MVSQDASVEFRFLNRGEVRALMPAMPKIVEIIEAGLAAYGRGEIGNWSESNGPGKARIRLERPAGRG